MYPIAHLQTALRAALLPALLYFLTVWFGINAFTRRYDLKGLPEEQQPARRDVIITSAFFAVPFLILLERMFIGGMTPQYAASVAILAAFLLLFIDGKLRFDGRKTVQRLEQACLNTGKQVAMIAAIILCASLIIGVLGATGLGVKITSLILSGSGEMLWPALLLTAGACLILGMEVPTTAAYVICISVAGPALQQLGLAPLQAHLFVFWFALLSTITPPVCGAVFIAAGMVDENWLKVSLNAMALGLGLYIIPLALIANPALIGLSDDPVSAVIQFMKIGLCLSAVSYGVIAPLNPILKAGLTIAGLTGIFFLPL